MQYLTLPLKSTKASAGYKNAYYKSQWGYAHYGIDVVSGVVGQRDIYASGVGTVVLCGCDGLNGNESKGCGNVIVIIYKDCVDRKTNKSIDLAVTYMHLASIKVKKGQTVNRTTVIGVEGTTGACSSGVHLHFQADTDTKYYNYCSGVSSSGHALLKHGTTDSTIDPLRVLWIGEGQTLKTYDSKWFNKAEWDKVSAAKVYYSVYAPNGELLETFGKKADADSYIKGMKIREE